MAARAIYKAVIRCGELSVPVKLYSAAVDRNVHFHLLHDKDLVRVKQRLVHPGTGEVVDHGEVRRGFEIERGRFVLLEPEELAEISPQSSRDLEITRFVDPAAIDHRWYERPYWLGPDGEDDDYRALAAALGERQLEGVARWVMRNKAYVGALRAEGPFLLLVSLRHPGEVIASAELEAPSGRPLEAKEQKMAAQLVEMLSGDLDLEEYRDEYRHRLRELIAAKGRGERVELRSFERAKAKRESLASSLEASLEGLRKQSVDKGSAARRRKSA